MRVNNNISIEGAKIAFRNFSGKEGTFNAAGNRNFCVILDDDDAHRLEEAGWNIKWLNPREEGDLPTGYLQVSVSFANIPPKIVLIGGNGKTSLDDTTISILDWAEIKNADVIIRPYNWEVNGKKGVKAYVSALYVTIVEDEFAHKYYDIPDSAASAMIDPV